ncbi:recombinase family protein [Alkalibacter mobilis]|uniref:recombinase family protein n=1 Tax=Alkalibacter mobilis TaxID=2787712 RepID=UPI002FC358AF
MKWGIRRKYERGDIKSIPSGKFLGYTKNNKGELIIHEAQAATVRRIYQDFLDGWGTYQIASKLTEENVPMAFGGKGWCADHVKKVLINEKYKGDTRFQKTYNADFITKRRVTNKGELPQYYLKDSHPAIIDENLWELVQLEIKRQKSYCDKYHLKTRYHNEQGFLFTGKIICGVCNNTFVQDFDNYENRFWRCKTFHGKRGTPIKDKMFTPPMKKRWSKNPRVISRRKDPLPKQMYCTHVKVEVKVLEQAFMDAWTILVVV